MAVLTFWVREAVTKGCHPMTNEEISAAEVAAFIAEKPARYFAYRVDGESKITTWTGEKLGHIQSAGKVYHSNFGDRRMSVRALGVNGVVYSGVAYLDAGDYVRLRAVKS
jgi:hypothetical protein